MKLRDRIKNNKHFLLILFAPAYLAGFFLMERLVPSTADYWVSYCWLDDLIPFCPYFVVPYCLWYPFLFAVGIYLLIKDVPEFKRYMYSIILGFTFCTVFCILFPNGQDLRPEIFDEENVFTYMVQKLYDTDTNTNVLPSVHAVGAILAATSMVRTKALKQRWIKGIVVCFAVLVCASVCLIKQHSILDVFAAMALCAVIYSYLCIIIKKDKMNS